MHLIVENSSYCNQSCLYCPRERHYRFKNMIMPMELFKAIIDGIYKLDIPLDRITFSGMGEPLTDPLLFEKAKYARKVCSYMDFNTNGQLLNGENSRLAKQAMSQVFLSIHGNTPEDYEKLTGNSFEKMKEIVGVAQGILGSKLVVMNYPEGRLASLLNLENPPAIHPFEDWDDKKISETLSAMGYEIAKPPCHLVSYCDYDYPLSYIKIRVNGLFTTCCRDYGMKNDILKKKFPRCKTCEQYSQFKNRVESTKKFDEYIEMLRRLDDETRKHTVPASIGKI